VCVVRGLDSFRHGWALEQVLSATPDLPIERRATDGCYRLPSADIDLVRDDLVNDAAAVGRFYWAE